MDAGVEADETDEHIAINPRPIRLRSQIGILVLSEDDRTNNRMPCTQDNQHKDRQNRVKVQNGQV